MSKYFLLLTLLLTGTTSYSQDVDTAKTTMVYTILETPPSFPGGVSAFFTYIAMNMVYPYEARLARAEGRIFVQFIVGVDGFVEKESVSVMRSVNPALDEEACRIVRESPKWNPGLYDGKPVRFQQVQPITFKLASGAGAEPGKKKKK